eukprot:TRINITY_DN3822_c0_g1_i2.p1 TRINITY_DN3822_c0_g1~~TRINITY_DN3822_c0_g1_i2.p1  ORF type:complete len:115 (-),score=42.88 TRINITY_DN3822_c0_g1_i2:219-563(-)
MQALISGFSILITAVVDTLSDLTNEKHRMLRDKEILQKQAKNNSAEAMKLMKESSSDSTLTDENRELKKKLIEIEKERKQMDDKLLEQEQAMKSLENKLQDFTLLLGDAQKKAV